MKIFARLVKIFALLFLFWILIFDFQRILFSIHYAKTVFSNPLGEWIQVFYQSFRLDIATAAFLSAIPLLFLITYLAFQKKILFQIFKYFVLFELLLISFVQAGEILAYGEWEHKLTTRVFVHLSHTDEVFRTASYSMTIWFVIYTLLQMTLGWFLFKWFFKKQGTERTAISGWTKLLLYLPILPVMLGISLVFARGGFQQIPINIDAAYYSKNYVLNDISVNSSYFLGKSYLLFKRSEIGKYLSHYDDKEVHDILSDFYTYDKTPTEKLLKVENPNVVFVILEGWSASLSNKISGQPGVTPVFDSLANDGVLFNNIYCTATTSDIGNISILSGYPALPEISMTMQPYKNKELRSINQSLKSRGYSAGYYFGGDLKYGNIQSYLMLHGFDRLHDENDFPKDLKRGKLNYYDHDLFHYFLNEIDQQKEPFMECVFTGSTHTPYDCPQPKRHHWNGAMPDYMNSVLYSNESIGEFINEAKKKSWFKNTLFIFVADHGHHSPYIADPSLTKYYHIPLLFYGPALKDSVRGKVISTLGSQADIAMTLLKQLGVNEEQYYPWSKNLLSKSVPEFALHTIIRGFGWVTPKGDFTYHYDYGRYLEDTFGDQLPHERKRCNAFMQVLYEDYQRLGGEKE